MDSELSRIINEVIDIVPESYHQMTELNLLAGVTTSASGAMVDSSGMGVDSVEGTVVSVAAAAAASSSVSVASRSAVPSAMNSSGGAGVAGTAITTNSMMGGNVSVASSNNLVLTRVGQGMQQQSPNVTAASPLPSGGGGSAADLLAGLSGNSSSNSNSSGNMNEQDAISQIEMSLRQYEKGGGSAYSGSPPAYPMHTLAPNNKFLPRTGNNGPLFANNGMSVALANNNNNNMSIPNNNSQGGFPMPPNYAQRPVGVGGIVQQRMAMCGQVPRSQNMQRERLLKEQQKQQLVVPVNATNSGLNPGLADIGSLINNSVAPNVSLQRNNSVVREAQLSPGFNSNAFQQMSPGQNQNSRAGQPFSPVQQQQQQVQQGPQGPPPNYQAFTTGTGGDIQPMSPQFGTPDIMALINMGKPTPVGGVLAQQLSPRQPPFNSAQSNQWTQQQLSLQQQQNPMLSAQLTVRRTL